MSVTPTTVTLQAGEATALSATARCSCGSVVETALSWSSSAPGVATVSDNGTVTAVSFGQTVISVTAQGRTATTFLTVEPMGTVVTEAGGTLVSSDGNATLEIPPGALTGPTDVTLAKGDDAWFQGDPFYVPGTAYQLGPEGLTLQVRARLRIRFDPQHLPEGALQERLRIRERDQDQQQWRETQQNRLRQQEHQMEAEIERLRIHAIVALDPAGIPVETVTVQPAQVSLHIDGTVQLAVQVLDADGLPLDRNVHWSSADESVATVTSAGLVTAVAYGVTDITAMAGGQSAAATIAVLPFGTLVGPSGGVVTADDGGAVLTIPEGALDEVVDVTLVSLADGTFASDPLYVPGTAYDLSPDRLQLHEQATLRIHYDPANLPAGVTQDRLRLRIREQDQQQWREMERQRLRLQEHAVEADLDHFSIYALVAKPETPPPPVAVITVAPAEVSLEPGETLQVVAYVYDELGNVLDVPVVWTSSDPSIATVDEEGLVTGVAEGSVVISAAAGGKQGQGSVNVGKGVKPASITVIPASAGVGVGGTVQLAAEVRDGDGNLMDKDPTWSSSNTAVATVSSTGLVTGVSLGNAVITARVGSVSGTADVTVNPPVASVVIDRSGNEPVEIGLTLQLTATAYGADGLPSTATIMWSSSDDGVATVDQTGLVTGVSRGTVTITAAVGSASDQVSIKVVGEGGEEEDGGNNSSWPVVFADGVGLTGLPVAEDPGVRPTVASGIVVDAVPFFWEGNLPDYLDTYYLQQGVNTWRPEYVDGTGQPAYDASAYWGDNLLAKAWKVGNPIRIEVALSATGVGTFTGYVMTYLYGEGPDEMQGTDGTTAEFVPLIYVPGATLKVEQISGQGGSVLGTVMDGAIGSEVNVGGRIIYGGQFKPTAEGWYRLTFQVPATANLMLREVGNAAEDGYTYPLIVGTKTTTIDIQVTS